MGKDNAVWLAGRVALVLFFLIFFALPITLVLYKGLLAGPVDFSHLFGRALGAARNSFFQALLSAFFALALGLPAAYLFARKEFPLRKAAKSLVLVPFVFPSILVVLSFVIVLGNNGWVNTFLRSIFGFSEPVNFLYGFSGVVLAHAFYNFPIVTGLVGAAWENTDSGMDEAARSLGAGRLRRFFGITLPQLLPSIAASAVLVFIYCFMSFAVVLSFGGLRFSTLEVEIYSLAMRSLDFGSASILAAFQFALLCIFSLLYWLVSRKFKSKQNSSSAARSPIVPFSLSGAIQCFFLILVLLSVLLPVFSILVFSLTSPESGAFSLFAFEKIFSQVPGPLGTSPFSAIFYSIIIALFASIVAVLMGLLASLPQTRSRLAGLALSCSVAVSAITLGLGYYIAFGAGNLLPIIFAHAVLAFPFAFFSIRNAIAKNGQAQEESSRTLGAGGLLALRFITLPRIRGSLVSAFAFCFAVSLGELGIVMMLYNGVYPTMPVYIYRLLGTFSVHSAAAMGLVLVFAGIACFYAVHSFSKDQWRLA